MIIKSAEFVISNTDYKKGPSDGRHEYAFIGRSNVGKSSLINMLTNKKGLAMTSSQPGKTMLINHFLVNDEWYLVDLPGYGYAKRSKESREQIRKIINGYILNREQLVNVFLLIDSRHEPQKIDLEFIDWLGNEGIPFAVVFTKMDKLTRSRGIANTNKYIATLKETWEELPPVFLTSSEKKQGGDEILNYIEEINLELKKDGK